LKHTRKLNLPEDEKFYMEAVHLLLVHMKDKNKKLNEKLKDFSIYTRDSTKEDQKLMFIDWDTFD